MTTPTVSVRNPAAPIRAQVAAKLYPPPAAPHRAQSRPAQKSKAVATPTPITLGQALRVGFLLIISFILAPPLLHDASKNPPAMSERAG